MNLSMNERAAALVDALVVDADALGIESHTLDSGARVVDCGAKARGGLQAGLGFATACMGGLGRIDPIGVAVGERTDVELEPHTLARWKPERDEGVIDAELVGGIEVLHRVGEASRGDDDGGSHIARTV